MSRVKAYSTVEGYKTNILFGKSFLNGFYIYHNKNRYFDQRYCPEEAYLLMPRLQSYYCNYLVIIDLPQNTLSLSGGNFVQAGASSLAFLIQ